jgi:hypothetical protein
VADEEAPDSTPEVDVDEEMTLEELRDFANGDLTGLPVDFEFKRRLRDRLWALLSKRDEESR